MPLRPQVRQLQAAGRRGDELLGHLTPGELVLPQSLQSPSVVAAIAQDARRKGINPSSLMAGSKFSSVNPATGLPEFADQEGHEQTFQELIAQIVERAQAISGQPQLPGAPLPGGPAVLPGTEVPFSFGQVTDFNKFGFSPEAILRDPNLIPGTNVPRGETTTGGGGGGDTTVDLSDFFEAEEGDDNDDFDGEPDGVAGGAPSSPGTEGPSSVGPGITGSQVGKTFGGIIGGVFGGPLGGIVGSMIGEQIGAAVDPLGEFANTFGEIGGPVGPSPRQDFNVAFTGIGAVGSIDGPAGFDPGFGSFEDIGEFGEPGGEAAGGFDPGFGGFEDVGDFGEPGGEVEGGFGGEASFGTGGTADFGGRGGTPSDPGQDPEGGFGEGSPSGSPSGSPGGSPGGGSPGGGTRGTGSPGGSPGGGTGTSGTSGSPGGGTSGTSGTGTGSGTGSYGGGGLIGATRKKSGKPVMIKAHEGEFVIPRHVVDIIGLDALNEFINSFQKS